MTLFEQVKECVTARQAAEHYGIKVKRNGMACCPFHKDRHPSMKADKMYHCFACGVGGDAMPSKNSICLSNSLWSAVKPGRKIKVAFSGSCPRFIQ